MSIYSKENITFNIHIQIKKQRKIKQCLKPGADQATRLN